MAASATKQKAVADNSQSSKFQAAVSAFKLKPVDEAADDQNDTKGSAETATNQSKAVSLAVSACTLKPADDAAANQISTKGSAGRAGTNKLRAAALAISSLKLKPSKNAAADTENTEGSAGTNKLKAVALALKIAGATTPWGEFSHLANEATDISGLSNAALKRHLVARNEVAEGTKQELSERLRSSVEEERQKKIAIELELEEKHRRIANLEERGAVYAVGKNDAGQLGLGSGAEDRREFVVIPCTRGKRFCHVSTGGNTTLATTDRHEVYVWGGSGLGPSGLHDNQRSMYGMPQLVEKLNGEEVVATSIGASHACASSLGGDLFVWGRTGGMTKDETNILQPQYLENTIGGGRGVASIDCGEMHTCVRSKEGEAFAWGHSSNGRLGFRADDGYQPTPRPVRLPSTSAVVRLVTCGSEHTLLCSPSAVFSFGCGDGGRLGQGDCSDRYEPCEIAALRGSHALSMSAGIWHSACVVHVAPFLDESGWLYTWGR